MAAEPSEMLYLEPDDEITTVVRRLRAASANRVVLIASGRTKATSSAIALRLLAQVAADEGRTIALVADGAARALAAEAGIDAFASVAEAEAEDASPEPAPAPQRAAIRVIRDAPERMSVPPVPRPTAGPTDETRVVPVVQPEGMPADQQATGRRRPRRPRSRRPLLLALAAMLLVGAAALAAVLPAASVSIVPATSALDARSYTVLPAVQGPDTATLRSTQDGSATGERIESIPATGTVTLYNWNGPSTPVEVPAGTLVSVAGGAEFRTDATVMVPGGHVIAGGSIEAGEADVGVTAVDGGADGNVAAKAINSVATQSVAALLTGPFQILPLVTNANPTTGGDEISHTVIEQSDVDAVVSALQADLRAKVAARLAADATRIYPSMTFVPPSVDVPGGLVGTEDQATFTLSGAYVFARSYVLVADVEAAAKAAFAADTGAVPPGMSVVPGTEEVKVGDARAVADGISVEVTVSARAAAQIDLDAARSQILGMTPAEARAALGSLGTVQVHLWPGWVDRIPRLDWRVDVEVVGG